MISSKADGQTPLSNAPPPPRICHGVLARNPAQVATCLHPRSPVVIDLVGAGLSGSRQLDGRDCGGNDLA